MSLQGWECPKCGSVWSPFTPGCATCAKAKPPDLTQAPPIDFTKIGPCSVCGKPVGSSDCQRSHP
jgi:hypothetical protein